MSKRKTDDILSREITARATAGRKKRPPALRLVLDDNEIIVDNFAGGGGASTGAADALGIEPHIAINHDAEAIAMHKANHPNTKHYIEDVYKVDPREACGKCRVALAWFSPDCKHHSKAKGGKPRNQKIRGLAWVAVRWAAAVKPRVIALENVEEFQDWGPLHKTGRDVGQPIKERKGETFRAFVRRLEKLGYVVEWKLLRACDYGAPTTRRRLFLVARRDGRPIVWPTPTHGPSSETPHIAAAAVIDWSVPCPSIFDRERPLADKTLARIARGVRKFVLENPEPFLIPGGGPQAISVPYMVHRSNGERKGQAPRIYDIKNPVGTIVAQGQKHALCAALLIKHYGGHESTTGGTSLTRSIDTITAQDHHSLVAVSLTKMYGTSTGSDVRTPVPTITANGKGGGHIGAVAAFLVRYNGKSEAQGLNKPAGTLTTKDRYALITVKIAGETYVLADIGMRMLTPRELYRAQGFPEAYNINPPGPDGKPLTKTAQIRMCGNSVCPPLASAIVRAQFQEAA